MSVGSVSGIVAGANVDKNEGSNASMLVARKALDVQKQQGEATARLIESARVEGPRGRNVNVFA